MVRVQRVTTVQELVPLQEEWDRLAARALEPEPYVTHEWVSLWCQHFAREGDLYLLLVWDDARLIGVAPLMRTVRRLKGLTVRQLGFLLNVCNVRANLLIDPNKARECLRALTEYLQTVKQEWDILALYGMSGASRVPEWLCTVPDIQHAGLRVFPVSSWENSYVSLAGGWEGYLAARSINFRRQVKREIRELETAGDVCFRCDSTPESVPQAVRTFLSVEARSWKAQGGDSLTARPDAQAFYQDLLHRYAGRRAWRQWTLSIDGQPVASIFGILYGGKLYAEKTAYVALPGKGSPGNTIIRHAIEQACQEDALSEIDLDQRTAFTGRWQTGVRPYHYVEIFNGTPYSQLLWRLKQWVRVWRGIRSGVRRQASETSV